MADNTISTENRTEWQTILKILFFSGIGVLFFFIPIGIGGKSTILLDHATGFITKSARPLAIVLLLLLMTYGAVEPFYKAALKHP